MKRLLISTATACGLMMSLSALAQDTTTVVTPDQTTVITDPQPDVVAVDPTYAAYPTTGWDPSLLMFASGGLAAGSLALKGFLRKRED